MLRLIVLTCCLTAAAAQQYFYCNTINPVTVTEREFFLVTRRPTETGYSAGLSCEFNAESDNGAFFVEIQSFKLSTAIFTISSGGRTLFRGSSIEAYQTSITTPSKSLQVRFDATGDHSNSEGVKIRVRMLNSNGCPPGWTFLYNNCFGTSTTSSHLNFFDAQKACNNMRSNLLQLPSLHSHSIGSFVRMLPSSLRVTYTWVGLTDRANRFRHYWLNGVRQSSTYEISCQSSGVYSSCYSYERCGTISDRSNTYAIFMGDCAQKRFFACSMPLGGTDHFYPVPGVSVIDVTFTGSRVWIWGVVAATMFVVGLTILSIYNALRYRARRAAGVGNAVVCPAGRVTVPPPSGTYPQQSQHPMPQYPAAPPTYDATVGGSVAQAKYPK